MEVPPASAGVAAKLADTVPTGAAALDTIGGFVLHELGKIPSTGDKFFYNNLSIEVISTVGRRLREIKILKT